MLELHAVSDLRDRLGQEVAVSDWLLVTQARIDAFAAATDDHQWIHVDPQRASASPFHGTVAHGFLTLSLVSRLLRDAITLPPLRMALNYGVNRVRFISPLPANSRIRARIVPAAVDDVSGSLQVTWSVTVEREGAAKPVAAIEWIVRYYEEAKDGGRRRRRAEGTEGTE